MLRKQHSHQQFHLRMYGQKFHLHVVSNMAVPVRFLHKSFPTIVTYYIVGFLFISQLLLGTIFHMANDVTFEFGVHRASRCCTMVYIFFLIKKKLFTPKFCHFMIKPFFMFISVASIDFTARFLPASEHLAFINWCHV